MKIGIVSDMPNWNDMRSIAYIPKLSEIGGKGF